MVSVPVCSNVHTYIINSNTIEIDLSVIYFPYRYVSVLVELTRMEGTQHGKLVASQMVDVAVRVQAIRSFTVAQMCLLLENSHLLAQPPARMADVLYAAAWICGEFSR